MSYNVPVLLLTFNRPKTTKKVFDVIKRLRPTKLFVVADGPRLGNSGDAKKCHEVRDIIDRGVSWKCDVKKIYRDENLGIAQGPYRAISWFFKQVNEGIVIEDDCLPDITFFEYCKELLAKYRDNPKIMLISGDNFNKKKYSPRNGYYFSKYAFTLGWASWRRAWKLYDFRMRDWSMIKKRKVIKRTFENIWERLYWYAIFDAIYKGRLTDAWDYQWQYAFWKNNSLAILPNVNLVEHIGYGQDAFHMKENDNQFREKRCSIKFPLVGPTKIARDVVRDEISTKIIFNPDLLKIIYLTKKYI